MIASDSTDAWTVSVYTDNNGQPGRLCWYDTQRFDSPELPTPGVRYWVARRDPRTPTMAPMVVYYPVTATTREWADVPRAFTVPEVPVALTVQLDPGSELAWYRLRFGTREDIEAEDRDDAAFNAEWDALTPEQRRAVLVAEGLTEAVDAGPEIMFVDVAERIAVRCKILREERDAIRNNETAEHLRRTAAEWDALRPEQRLRALNIAEAELDADAKERDALRAEIAALRELPEKFRKNAAFLEEVTQRVVSDDAEVRLTNRMLARVKRECADEIDAVPRAGGE